MGATGKSRPAMCHPRDLGESKNKKNLRLEMENLWLLSRLLAKQLIFDGFYLVMFLFLYFFKVAQSIKHSRIGIENLLCSPVDVVT